jgi:hypothetical protein
VTDRTAAEVVALDPALEALADRDPGDLDLLARLEGLDGDVVADLGTVLGAEAFFTWPSSALLSLPSLVAPKAS